MTYKDIIYEKRGPVAHITFNRPEKMNALSTKSGGLPNTFTWPYFIGLKKTKELTFTGNLIDAHEALNFGLVNKVVPNDKLDEEVGKLADAIIKVPAMTVKLAKVSVNNMFELMGFRQGIQQNRELDHHVHSSAPPEFVEFIKITASKGLKAALEWRDAKFSENSGVGEELRDRKY